MKCLLSGTCDFFNRHLRPPLYPSNSSLHSSLIIRCKDLKGASRRGLQGVGNLVEIPFVNQANCWGCLILRTDTNRPWGCWKGGMKGAFYCWYIFGLFPVWGYYGWCFYKPSKTDVHISLGYMYSGVELVIHETRTYSAKWMYWLTLPSSILESSSSFVFLPIFTLTILVGIQWLVSISLMSIKLFSFSYILWSFGHLL